MVLTGESVTADDAAPGARAATRNAAPKPSPVVLRRRARMRALRAEARKIVAHPTPAQAQEIESNRYYARMFGRKGDDVALWAKWAHRRGQDEARWCAFCDADLPEVYRVRCRMCPSGGTWRKTAWWALCAECADEEVTEDSWAPCEGCGRPLVVIGWDYIYRKRRVCCDYCRGLAVAREKRERRTDARAGRTCGQCNEVIDASRNDARYCSSACRQKAYRQRHRPTGDPITEEET
jgi:hypothetical protein